MFLRSKKVEVWVGRWLEGVIGPDNKVIRVHRSEVIGTKADFTRRLGHEKAETTLGYTHAIGEDDRRVADEIGNILCSSLPKSSEVKPDKQLPVQ